MLRAELADRSERRGHIRRRLGRHLHQTPGSTWYYIMGAGLNPPDDKIRP